MASLNRVLIIGNLTRDPELRHTSGGSAVCKLGVAINRRFTTSGGEQREETCFVDVDIWGRQAEACGRYLNKGAQVFVEGRLQMDEWQDRETGRKRSRLRINGERVQFLDSRQQGEGGGGGYQQRSGDDGDYYQQNQAPPPQFQSQKTAAPAQQAPPMPTPQTPDDNFNTDFHDDDIPF